MGTFKRYLRHARRANPVMAGVAILGIMAGSLVPITVSTAPSPAASNPAASNRLPEGYSAVYGSTRERISVAQAAADGAGETHTSTPAIEVCYTSHNWVKVVEKIYRFTAARYDRYWNWCSYTKTSQIIGIPTVRDTHSESAGWTLDGVQIRDGQYAPGSADLPYRGLADLRWKFAAISHSATLADTIYYCGDVRQDTVKP